MSFHSSTINWVAQNEPNYPPYNYKALSQTLSRRIVAITYSHCKIAQDLVQLSSGSLRSLRVLFFSCRLYLFRFSLNYIHHHIIMTFVVSQNKNIFKHLFISFYCSVLKFNEQVIINTV